MGRLFESGAYLGNYCNSQLKSLLQLGQIVITFRTLLRLGLLQQIVGIQLYSSLSLLARQSMLMLTELPGMVIVFEQFFNLDFGDSYTCNIHGDPRIEGYHYCICQSVVYYVEN